MSQLDGCISAMFLNRKNSTSLLCLWLVASSPSVTIELSCAALGPMWPNNELIQLINLTFSYYHFFLFIYLLHLFSRTSRSKAVEICMHGWNNSASLRSVIVLSACISSAAFQKVIWTLHRRKSLTFLLKRITDRLAFVRSQPLKASLPSCPSPHPLAFQWNTHNVLIRENNLWSYSEDQITKTVNRHQKKSTHPQSFSSAKSFNWSGSQDGLSVNSNNQASRKHRQHYLQVDLCIYLFK